MNILQVLPELNVGGVERGTVDLSGFFVKNGHKSVVVSAGGELIKDVREAGGIHYQLPVNEKSIFTVIKTIKQLAAIIQKENIDIVHARSRVPAWIAFFACRRTGAKFLTTCHGYYSVHVFSRVMGWPKIVIVPSQVIGRHMIEDFGVPRERIRLIPRSVDLDKFVFKGPEEKSKTEFVVGIIGRITPLKGHTYFLQAMAKVVRVFPYLKIWIVGEFPKEKEAYKEEVHKLVSRLGLIHNVQFMGNQRNIPAILHKLHVVVLSTVTEEAFGRVIVEAQASGVPVVATQVGGVIDIIEDGSDGLLVAARDTDAMAEAVINILKDSNLARTLAQNGRKKVEEQFTLTLMAKRTIDVYKELQSSQNILVIKMSAIGDVILAVPSLRALKAKFPKVKIFCLVGVQSRQILEGCPFIDGLIVHDFKTAGIKDMMAIGKELRRYAFDMAVDLQNNAKSHLLSYLSAAPQRYGYDNGKWGFLLNHRIKNNVVLPAVEHQFRILEMLGITLEDDRLELWPSKEDDEYIQEFLESYWLKEKEKLVGISLGASRKWTTKNWPVASYARFCDELAKQNVRVVVVGSEEDRGLAQQLAVGSSAKSIIAVGKTTLKQLASLIRRCCVFVGADSAPLHIAAAMNTPFVALFGPTDPARHLPPAKSYIILKKDIECSPCYKPQCKKNICMEQIRVEEVMAAVEKLLG